MSDPEHVFRIKRMLAAGSMLEDVTLSLRSFLASQPDFQAKLSRHPNFTTEILDQLLERLVPFFDEMTDQEIDEVTVWNASPAGLIYQRLMKVVVQNLPSVAGEWWKSAIDAFTKLP